MLDGHCVGIRAEISVKGLKLHQSQGECSRVHCVILNDLKADVGDARFNVRFWHLADMDAASENVRFWGKADIRDGHLRASVASGASSFAARSGPLMGRVMDGHPA